MDVVVGREAEGLDLEDGDRDRRKMDVLVAPRTGVGALAADLLRGVSGRHLIDRADESADRVAGTAAASAVTGLGSPIG